MDLKFPCPSAALPKIIEELEKHGVKITHPEGKQDMGEARCIAGRAVFFNDAGVLYVKIVENRNHFPEAMIRGGLRQLVSEASEQLDALRDPVN